MRLLLDTHILIWALNGDRRLPAKARRLILDDGNTLYYSTVSLWEVSIKHAIHPENVEFTGEDLDYFCREAGFLPVEVKNSHVIYLESLRRSEGAPPHHDPFDRMLIAQAKAENLVLITHDSLLSYYNEKCVMNV
jgi:Uncharacterized protein conserved in bacteria